MRIINYPSVSFSIEKDEENGIVNLQFAEVQQMVPGAPPTVTAIHVIPFPPQAWANFKRHVEADGEVPAIEIAKVVPGGPNGGA